jgi:hypothetical protein
MKVQGSSLLCGALLLVALPVAAQDVRRECIDASTAGQTSRDAGATLEARSQFLMCASDVCPAVVRSSCGRWLSEIEQQIPSVVIRAADASNVDITEGKVTIDGVQVPLDGKPLSLDPGPHLIVVDAARGVHLEKKVLLASGEKSRLIELRAEPLPKRPTIAPTLPPALPTPNRSGSIGPWLLGGTSLVALGSFTFFAFTAKGELNRLQETCSPRCSAADRAAGERDALVADVSLGVSVAALAGALTWALIDSPAPDQRVAFSIAAVKQGGFASVRARF